MAKKGFTLVELSIVLVIIGLLIGGILVAQSMIGATKINAQLKQFSEFDIALGNFRTTYAGLPGDSNRFDPSVGDGDGIIEGTEIAPSHTAFDQEVAYFWRQLSQTGLKTETGSPYSNAATTGVRVNTNVPKAIFGRNTTAVGIRPGVDVDSVTTYSYYEIADYNSVTDNEDDYGDLADSYDTGLSPRDALALDKKMDNSIANTGMVKTGGVANSCQTFGTYENSGTSCRLYIRILSYEN